jgi:hypothetical protein
MYLVGGPNETKGSPNMNSKSSKSARKSVRATDRKNWIDACKLADALGGVVQATNESPTGYKVIVFTGK